MQGMIQARKGKRGTTYQVIISYTDQNGKARQIWKTTKTKKDAETLRNELLVQAQNGIDIDPEKITFSEYLDKWLKDFGKTNLAPRTLESYISVIEKHLKPELGHIQLSKLSPSHLRDFYTKSLTDGRKDSKKTKGSALTASTVKHFHRLIHLALRQAVRWELVFRNVADAVDPPKQASELDETKDLVFLNEQEIETLFKSIKSNYAYIPAYIAVNTGMRLGEVLGLRWQDIDLEGKILTINQTMQCVNREIKFRNKAKTKGSRRTIDLPDNLIVFLKKLQLEQETQKRWTHKDVYQDHDLVCCREDGTPINLHSFGSYFIRLAKRAGINASFHSLRHTHASLLLKAGEYPKVISERLGHTQIGITMDIYSHIMPGMQKQAAEKIDLILAGRI